MLGQIILNAKGKLNDVLYSVFLGSQTHFHIQVYIKPCGAPVENSYFGAQICVRHFTPPDRGDRMGYNYASLLNNFPQR